MKKFLLVLLLPFLALTQDSWINIDIHTDDWPEETSWELLDESEVVIASGGPYESEQTLYSETINLNSGEYADIKFTQGTSASKNGRFEVDLTESHYGTGTPYSSRSDIMYSGDKIYNPEALAAGYAVVLTQWRIDFPVDKIGNPFNSGELDYTVRVINSGNATNEIGRAHV